MEKIIKKRLIESAEIKERIAAEGSGEIADIAERIISCYKREGKVVLFGNGGSAADAQHLAAELVGRFKLDRCALPAIALTTDTSVLTAIGNDYGFDQIFEKQVEGIVNKGDVAIGITTSGNSINVIKAIQKAKSIGAVTIGFTGAEGGKISQIADHTIKVPSDDTPRIQEAHITIGHILCELIESTLFK